MARATGKPYDAAMRIAALLAILGCGGHPLDHPDAEPADSYTPGPRINAFDATFPLSTSGGVAWKDVRVENHGDNGLTITGVSINDPSGWISFFPTSSCSETNPSCTFGEPIVLIPNTTGNWMVLGLYCRPLSTGVIHGEVTFASDSVGGKPTALVTCQAK